VQNFKRRTKDNAELQEPVNAQDVADAVGRQLRIHMVPELVDLEGESLREVGEYRLPLKLVLASGDRATLDVSISST
jgi:ribosomal protein L9